MQKVNLYKDSLYLNDYGKDELEKNFIDNINNFLCENIFQMTGFWIDSV